MEQLELDLKLADNEEYWKNKYDNLMRSYIKLEETLYALRTSVALLKDVALESGQAS